MGESVNEVDVWRGKEHLVDALNEIYADLTSPTGPEEPWENPTLESFLESFIAQMDNLGDSRKYRKEGVPDNAWEIIGDTFRWDRYYE